MAAPESAVDVKRRQVNLPGTRFSPGLPPPPPVSLPGSVSIDPTLTGTFPGSPISTTAVSDSSPTPSPTDTMASLPGSIFQTSPTDSAPASSSTIVPFAFEDIVYPESCSSTVIDWICNGPDLTFDFVVKSSIAPHTDIAFPRKRDVANLIIASNLHTTSQTYTWSPVDVPQGWYTIIAQGQGWQVPSSQFFVTNGTDESCLGSSSSTSAPPGSSTSFASTTRSASLTSTTSSATSLPVVAATTNSRTGAIAGGVVGGVLILAAAIAGYIYFGLCRRSPTRSRRRAMEGPAQLGKWGGLSSRDSGMDAPMAGKPSLPMVLPSKTKKRGATDSTGAMLSAAQHRSDEDVATLASVEQKSKGYEYVETVPPMAYNGRRRSSASYGAGMSPVASIPEQQQYGAGSLGHSRARSSSQSHRAMALAKLDGNDAVPAPASHPRSPPAPRRSIESPSSPSYESPMNRSSSGGGPGPRRAARKPVPQLDVSELSNVNVNVNRSAPGAGASVSRGQSLSSTVTAVSGSASSTPVTPSAMYTYRSESESAGTLRVPGHGPVRQHSREDLEAAGMELPSLNHKSSFGDRPVHYLIPDMPPPVPRN